MLLFNEIWKWTDLPPNWRQPVIVALFLFAILLVIAARYQTRVLLTAAVLGNIAWVIAGMFALFETGTILGILIISVVILADAIMAWLQAKHPNQAML